MKEPYLQVTFRRGRPIAAYYYLPRKPRGKSVRTRRAASGMLVDFSRAGRPIGIEITAPSKMSVSALNRLLRELGFSAVTRNDVARYIPNPVKAARIKAGLSQEEVALRMA